MTYNLKNLKIFSTINSNISKSSNCCNNNSNDFILCKSSFLISNDNCFPCIFSNSSKNM